MVHFGLLLYKIESVRKGSKTIWLIYLHRLDSRGSMGKYSLMLYAFEENEIGIFNFIASCKTFLRKLEDVGKLIDGFVGHEAVF